MELVIDKREHAILERFPENGTTIKSEQLHLGDIQLKYNDQVKLIIERKSLKDLIASIKDGRYLEQSLRLINNGLCHLHHVVYLIEGNIHSLSEVERQIAYSSMVSVQFIKGFSLVRTQSIDETCIYIEFLMRKLNKSFESGTDLFHNATTQPDTQPNRDYCNVIKTVKKENITRENIGTIMLMQIPGISAVMATAILSKFSSFVDLIEQINQDPSVLDGLTYESKGKERKINKNCIANIKEMLCKNI
jgi:ERCC4-type nuclease